MKRDMWTLLILAMAAVASAATATWAQKDDAEKPAVVRDFVKVGYTYLRASRIDSVSIQENFVHLSIGGKTGDFELKDCAELFRVLGLPPVDKPKPAP
jgi:hypothetical protein